GAADAGIDHEFPPEKHVDLAASYPAKKGTVSWRKVRPTGDGYVDLRAFHGSDSGQIVSYLYREIESPDEQDATIHLGTDDCSKLWLNRQKVYESRQHRAAAPEQEIVNVRLKKGKNTLLLKINNGDGPHGFYLSIQADQE